MLERMALRLVVGAATMAAIAVLVPGIHIHGGLAALLWLSVLFSLVNLICGTVLRLISLPLIILTLGLFLLVINAIVLALTAALSSHLDIDGFVAAFVGALLIAVIGWLAELVLPLRSRHCLDAVARLSEKSRDLGNLPLAMGVDHRE